jgi:hypothetical protein
MLIEMATASDLGEHIIRTNPTPVIGSRKKTNEAWLSKWEE